MLGRFFGCFLTGLQPSWEVGKGWQFINEESTGPRCSSEYGLACYSVLHIWVIYILDTRAERVCHDDAESKAAHVLVEVALIFVICGQVEEQLFGLELLARDERCGHGYRRHLPHHPSQSTPARSIRHRGHPIATCDYVVTHRRRGLGGRDDGLLLENLSYGLWRVDDHPVVPAHANLEDIAIFYRPFAEDGGRLGWKFVPDTNQWVPLWARYRIKSLVTA